ncbi:MAG: hypothetical protein JOY89_07110, partial [Solirubrobacterales bacterium]|nr:hypothetical protein [Solirubrobacterales bacterium]
MELLHEHERALREVEHMRAENARLQRELEERARVSEQQARQIAELSRRVAATGNRPTNGTVKGNGHSGQHEGEGTGSWFGGAAPRGAAP